MRAARGGALEFTLAGHLPLLRVRRGAAGVVDELAVSQIPLGVIETQTFDERERGVRAG